LIHVNESALIHSIDTSFNSKLPEIIYASYRLHGFLQQNEILKLNYPRSNVRNSGNYG